MIKVHEFTGTIEKIEKSNISKVDLVSISTDNNQTTMRMELVNEINPFKESDPVKLIFDTKPASESSQKLILNGYIYSIKKVQDIHEIDITIGGLQLKIQTPNEYHDFKVKQDISIQIF